MFDIIKHTEVHLRDWVYFFYFGIQINRHTTYSLIVQLIGAFAFSFALITLSNNGFLQIPYNYYRDNAQKKEKYFIGNITCHEVYCLMQIVIFSYLLTFSKEQCLAVLLFLFLKNLLNFFSPNILILCGLDPHKFKKGEIGL